MNVNSSTTTLTFTAPSLPNSMFSGTIVVMVAAMNRFGVGPPSDLQIAKFTGTYTYVHGTSIVHSTIVLVRDTM